MTVKERKAREKAELRDLILQGAKKLFVEKGVEQTTIRSIANAIDYSIGTVYVYFKDKDAILHALHTQGFSELGGRFRVLGSVPDPMQRLIAMGRIYIDFAKENPDMYELMFNLRAPIDFLTAMHQEQWNEGKATFEALRGTVKSCLDAGRFAGHQVEPLSFMIWSTVHGMCSLWVAGRSGGVDLNEPETIVERAFDEFVALLYKV